MKQNTKELNSSKIRSYCYNQVRDAIERYDIVIDESFLDHCGIYESPEETSPERVFYKVTYRLPWEILSTLVVLLRAAESVYGYLDRDIISELYYDYRKNYSDLVRDDYKARRILFPEASDTYQDDSKLLYNDSLYECPLNLSKMVSACFGDNGEVVRHIVFVDGVYSGLTRTVRAEDLLASLPF